MRGEKVKDLTVNDEGNVSWDGRNDSGEVVATGVYFVRIQGPNGDKTLKVAVQR